MFYNLFIARDGEQFNPISLVTTNDITDLYELGPRMHSIGEYRKGMVYERYGINYIDFCKLPMYVADLILLESSLETKAQAEKSERADQQQKDEQRRLENELNNGV